MTNGTDGIQSLVFTGFASLDAARFLLLRVVDPPAARASLGRLVEHGLRFGKGTREDRWHTALQIAFSADGLRTLGVTEDVLQTFERPFVEGIETEHRKRVLGDEGDNAPEHWAWRQRDLHAVLFVYAKGPELDAYTEATAARLAGWQVVRMLDTVTLDANREHFGFHDGIAQPKLALATDDGPASPPDALPLGEFVLGHRDLADQPAPTAADAGEATRQDGSYLVLRQLQEDVPAFWQDIRRRAGPDEQHAVWLAAKMMGRWPNGMPLAPGPVGPQPELPPGGTLPNGGELAYGADPQGLGCPRGAHVRRANPRDALGSEENVKRHRILRRGRCYGLPAPASVFPAGVTVTARAGTGALEDDRGLLFACLCADLSRQFELIQQTWLNNPKHDGLFDEVDPIASGQAITADERRYTIPEAPVRCRLHAVPFTVRVRGGAYLFLPGKAALSRLAEG
ncbi:MAG: peroxidase [Pseudomonadota bacterium]|nr:peroxidase [Pseudomonadota bacterium]